MEFIVALLDKLHSDRAMPLSTAASETYYTTLQRYHGWIVTGTFTVALKLVPSRWAPRLQVCVIKALMQGCVMKVCCVNRLPATSPRPFTPRYAIPSRTAQGDIFREGGGTGGRRLHHAADARLLHRLWRGAGGHPNLPGRKRPGRPHQSLGRLPRESRLGAYVLLTVAGPISNLGRAARPPLERWLRDLRTICEMN